MRVKDVIKKLQELDPTGEIQCCINNVYDFEINILPSNYDGSLQILERDEKNNIIEAKINTNEKKISFQEFSIEDLLYDHCFTPIKIFNKKHQYHLNNIINWRREGYNEVALIIDRYPCKKCIREPLDFSNIDYKCFTCYPLNNFEFFEEKSS